MSVPSYSDFITSYPAYGQIPYDELDITGRLAEAELVFPQILSCLPPATHLLAFYYAVRYGFEIEECESPVPVKSVSSRNDGIVYALAGDGNILGNTTWGSKLNKLFKVYGCFQRANGSGGVCRESECC